jgi:Tol biopolymer transport system component
MSQSTEVSQPVTTQLALVRTDLTNQTTRTFATVEVSPVNAEAWNWGPDGKTLAYFAGSRLFLKVGDQPANVVGSYKFPGGRGGSWDDEIAVRFSPSGKYFVDVHTVTVPLTFEIRRTSDGSVVWSAPNRSPDFATMSIWSRQSDLLYFRDGTGVRTWEPSGTVSTLVPNVRWYHPSISPDGRTIAYMVIGPAGLHSSVELLDLQTLKVRALPSVAGSSPFFASDALLVYRKMEPGTLVNGVLSYNLNTGARTELPFAMVLDVWPR